VVIVTWNRKAHVDRVIEALTEQTHPGDAMDVVVVDNASDDGTCEHLRSKWRAERVVQNPTALAHEPAFETPALNGMRNRAGFRSLTIVRNSENLGGCGGFNTGFAFVHDVLAPDRAPDYVWLVDDDVDLPENALAQLVMTGESDPSIGLVGSRAVDLNDRATTIESTIYFDRRRGRMDESPSPSSPRHASHVKWIEKVGATKGEGAGPFSGVREVDVASACSLLARWSAVREVGFWDYRYFIYCDDADWCLRFGRAGYRVVCDLDAVVYHTPWYQKLTPARLYYSQRNILWLIQKTLPVWRMRYATLRWMGSILTDCLHAALHRRVFHAEIIRRTAADVMRNRGGKLENEGPAKIDVVEALRETGALRGGATVAVVCRLPGAQAWTRELREQVLRELRDGEEEPRWVAMVRNDVTGRGDDLENGIERIEYSRRIRSKLFRQARLLLRAPRAVIVFDQTCDLPLLRGRRNIHIDRKWPELAQVERDGVLPRAGFLCRWVWTVGRAMIYSVTLRRYQSPHRYG